eukprot:4944002-Amphidinium_carterae.3
MKYPQPWDNNPHSLGGIMKVPASSTAPLAQFAKQTILPLAALLRVRVFLVGRRGQENEVRISYLPSNVDPLPIRAATIEESNDFRYLLEHMGHLCHSCYLPFVLSGENTFALFHHWSDSGRLCQEALLTVLRCAVDFARGTLRLTLPTSLMLLYEAHQLVVVGRPLTCHDTAQQVDELVPLLQQFLMRNAVRAGTDEWNLTIASGLVAGGSIGSSMCARAIGVWTMSSLLSTWYYGFLLIAAVLIALGKCFFLVTSRYKGLAMCSFSFTTGGALHGIAGTAGPYVNDYQPIMNVGTDEAEQGVRFVVRNAHDLSAMARRHQEVQEALAKGFLLEDPDTFEALEHPEHWQLDAWDIDFFLNPSFCHDDEETLYLDPEPEQVDSSRDRRICLLAIDLCHAVAGFDVAHDVAISCEPVLEGPGATLLNPNELTRLIALSRSDMRLACGRWLVYILAVRGLHLGGVR